MTPQFLLDTHVIIRWLFESRKLSREQSRRLEHLVRSDQPIGLSAMSLLEISFLSYDGRLHLKTSTSELLATLEANPLIQIIPVSFEIALEAGALRVLRDPADRAIVATARVHGMQLLTSDERILQSGLARTIA